jgi:hypothetical protein
MWAHSLQERDGTFDGIVAAVSGYPLSSKDDGDKGRQEPSPTHVLFLQDLFKIVSFDRKMTEIF